MLDQAGEEDDDGADIHRDEDREADADADAADILDEDAADGNRGVVLPAGDGGADEVRRRPILATVYSTREIAACLLLDHIAVCTTE